MVEPYSTSTVPVPVLVPVISRPPDRSELILRMSGGIESGEFAQSLPPVIDTFKVPIPKSSQTVGEITGEGVRVRINRFIASAEGVRVWQFTVFARWKRIIAAVGGVCLG